MTQSAKCLPSKQTDKVLHWDPYPCNVSGVMTHTVHTLYTHCNPGTEEAEVGCSLELMANPSGGLVRSRFNRDPVPKNKE